MFISLPGISDTPAWLEDGATTKRWQRRLLTTDYNKHVPRTGFWHTFGPIMLSITLGTLAGLLLYYMLPVEWRDQYSLLALLPTIGAWAAAFFLTIPMVKVWYKLVDKHRRDQASRRIGLVWGLTRFGGLHLMGVSTPLGILVNYLTMYKWAGKYDEWVLYENYSPDVDLEVIELLSSNSAALMSYLDDQKVRYSYAKFLENEYADMRDSIYYDTDGIDYHRARDDSEQSLFGYLAWMHFLSTKKGIYRESEDLAVIATKANALAQQLLGITAPAQPAATN